jgi:hypothetical protein
MVEEDPLPYLESDGKLRISHKKLAATTFSIKTLEIISDIVSFFKQQFLSCLLGSNSTKEAIPFDKSERSEKYPRGLGNGCSLLLQVQMINEPFKQ